MFFHLVQAATEETPLERSIEKLLVKSDFQL